MKTLARAADHDELRRRLASLGPEQVRRWGRMTVGQMVCHLADSFEMALGRKPVTSRAGPLQRTLVKWLALYAPLPWPPGIRTSPEIDQTLGQCTVPVDFESDRARIGCLMDEMARQDAAFAWPAHPVFGPMSPAAWLRWGYLHTNHHLRQFGV